MIWEYSFWDNALCTFLWVIIVLRTYLQYHSRSCNRKSVLCGCIALYPNIWYFFSRVLWEQDAYLISIKICAPLDFAPLIFAPLMFTHLQILCPFNFRSPLFYCKFAFFRSFVTFFSPFDFRAFLLRELAPFNFHVSYMIRNDIWYKNLPKSSFSYP